MRGSSSFLRMSLAGVCRSSASRSTIMSSFFLSSLRSTVMTLAIRFSTSGRPAASRIRPRIGGSLITRTELLCAAAAKSPVAATWRYQRRAKSAPKSARTMTPTIDIRTRLSISPAFLGRGATRRGGATCGSPCWPAGLRSCTRGVVPEDESDDREHDRGHHGVVERGQDHDPERPELEQLLLAHQGPDPHEQHAADQPAEEPEHRGHP